MPDSNFELKFTSYETILLFITHLEFIHLAEKNSGAMQLVFRN